MILLTKSSTPIIGQLASVMGWIMDGIYRVLDLVGIQNLGLCIIIFSIIIYALMTPLQVKQQKFSKLSSVMQPELQKIQKKYKDKKDQASMQKMQEETQLVYQKYGVSPTGSCVQLLIQFPVLMALWQVIYKIPGYGGIRFPCHLKIIICCLSWIARSQYKTRLPVLPVAGRPHCCALSLVGRPKAAEAVKGIGEYR